MLAFPPGGLWSSDTYVRPKLKRSSSATRDLRCVRGRKSRRIGRKKMMRSRIVVVTPWLM